MASGSGSLDTIGSSSGSASAGGAAPSALEPNGTARTSLIATSATSSDGFKGTARANASATWADCIAVSDSPILAQNPYIRLTFSTTASIGSSEYYYSTVSFTAIGTNEYGIGNGVDVAEFSAKDPFYGVRHTLNIGSTLVLDVPLTTSGVYGGGIGPLPPDRNSS
jgi:hypothetical protein